MNFFWLIELVPAFDGHPPFPATYYAGYMLSAIDAAKTQDVHASPKFMRKADAENVANELRVGHTLSCQWKAVEHGFDTEDRAANGKIEIRKVLDEMREIAEDLYVNGVTTSGEDQAIEEWFYRLECRLAKEGRIDYVQHPKL